MIGALAPRPDVRRSLLELVGRALAPPRGMTGVAKPRKILVVRPDHLGDLLMLTPALRRLRLGCPTAEIVGLIGPWGVPVLEKNPNLDRLIAWSFPWFDRQPRHSLLSPYLSLARLSRRLREERFDLAIQFRADFWWGALAVRLANVPDQLGFDAPVIRPFLTRSIPLQHGLPAARENLRLVDAVLGPTNGAEALEFPRSESDRDRASNLLASIEGGRPLVALQVGAGAPVKLWPLDRLAAVGRALRDEYGVAIVAIGGPGEVEAVRDVAEAIGRDAIDLGGKTTIGELAAVLERCHLAVGPDSGPLHLAVAVGTPTLHLYGPADARRFGPFGDPTWHVVVQSPRPCAPCNRLEFPVSELEAHGCVGDIGVEEVTRAARTLLERSLENFGNGRRPR